MKNLKIFFIEYKINSEKEVKSIRLWLQVSSWNSSLPRISELPPAFKHYDRSDDLPPILNNNIILFYLILTRAWYCSFPVRYFLEIFLCSALSLSVSAIHRLTVQWRPRPGECHTEIWRHQDWVISYLEIDQPRMVRRGLEEYIIKHLKSISHFKINVSFYSATMSFPRNEGRKKYFLSESKSSINENFVKQNAPFAPR